TSWCTGASLGDRSGVSSRRPHRARIHLASTTRVTGAVAASSSISAMTRSSSPWRYRRKLTLALRRVQGRWIAGLHPYDAPGRVFALHDCLITDEQVARAWHQVIAAQSELPHAAE